MPLGGVSERENILKALNIYLVFFLSEENFDSNMICYLSCYHTYMYMYMVAVWILWFSAGPISVGTIISICV